MLSVKYSGLRLEPVRMPAHMIGRTGSAIKSR